MCLGSECKVLSFPVSHPSCPSPTLQMKGIIPPHPKLLYSEIHYGRCKTSRTPKESIDWKREWVTFPFTGQVVFSYLFQQSWKGTKSELSADRSLKEFFVRSLCDFLHIIWKEFKEWGITITRLYSFSPTYLCRHVFSMLTSMELKTWTGIDAELSLILVILIYW